jgi:hypothetical protein
MLFCVPIKLNAINFIKNYTQQIQSFIQLSIASYKYLYLKIE